MALLTMNPPDTVTFADYRVRVDDLEAHRGTLLRHCQRMLGSAFEAEDAVQETLVRAWRSLDHFERRSSLRAWLRRIATNVCLDMIRRPDRRAVAMDLGPSSAAGASLVDGRVEDPADVAASKEAVQRAFVTALRYLPARQRAVLILHDVLRWHAREVADLLDTSEAAVNSALQRGRATLAACHRKASNSKALDARQLTLVARYVDAFERYDLASLVSLSQIDADCA